MKLSGTTVVLISSQRHVNGPGPATLPQGERVLTACARLSTLCEKMLLHFTLCMCFFVVRKPVYYTALGQLPCYICPLWGEDRSHCCSTGGVLTVLLPWAVCRRNPWPWEIDAHHWSWPQAASSPWQCSVIASSVRLVFRDGSDTEVQWAAETTCSAETKHMMNKMFYIFKAKELIFMEMNFMIKMLCVQYNSIEG